MSIIKLNKSAVMEYGSKNMIPGSLNVNGKYISWEFLPTCAASNKDFRKIISYIGELYRLSDDWYDGRETLEKINWRVC